MPEEGECRIRLGRGAGLPAKRPSGAEGWTTLRNGGLRLNRLGYELDAQRRAHAGHGIEAR